MFSNNAEKIQIKTNSLIPVGSLEYEELKRVVSMINTLSYQQWVYIKDPVDALKTHLKLGTGELQIDTIANVTAAGAPIDISGDTLRVFTVDMKHLEQSYQAKIHESTRFRNIF